MQVCRSGDTWVAPIGLAWIDFDRCGERSVGIRSYTGRAHHDQLVALLHDSVRGGVDQAPVTGRVHLMQAARFVPKESLSQA